MEIEFLARAELKFENGSDSDQPSKDS